MKKLVLMKIIRIMLLALLCFTLSCHPKNKESLSEMVAGLTPPDWKMYDEVKYFTAENLYEQINGRAEFYIAYNVVGMTFAGFEENRKNGHFFDLSIFDMGTPTNAFGVFSGERSPGAPPLGLGRAAYRSGANYYIWKGRYYIRIITADTTEKLRQIGLNLSRKVTAFLIDSGETVWGLETLPRENRVPGSEGYFFVDALGLDFMRNIYISQYTMGDTVVTAFLSQRDSRESARSTVNSFIQYVNRYGKGIKNLTIEEIELVICDMGGSYDVVFRKGSMVGGVSAVKDQKDAVRAAINLWRQLQ
ncbi:DUF6599 family protein [Acidobacteriota bacterium]